MFVDKHLPDGRETWKQSRINWVKNTTGLLISAGKEYRSSSELNDSHYISAEKARSHLLIK